MIEPLFQSPAIEYRETKDIPRQSILNLYHANHWSSAHKPEELYCGLMNAHAIVTAWEAGELIGLASSLSDGYLVVYYSHTLVMPSYQGWGIGTEIMRRLMRRYEGFHQQLLLADGGAVEFYRRLGFERAGKTEPMWIFQGDEH